jgi:hypothetical protein
MTNNFKLRRQWLGSPQSKSEDDATLCRLQIDVNDRNVTTYMSHDRESSDHLEIPAYYLAEWVAENWWALLWEPRKSEDSGDDADFIARHSIITAQHGFPLPKISIIPTGKNVFVSATARDVQFADIRFRNSASITVSRSELESELKNFVQKVVLRLDEFSIAQTDLQEIWNMIEGTGADEHQFCRFVGALGLSPYAVDDEIEAILDEALSKFGERVLMDLCLASNSDNLALSVEAAKLAYSQISSVQTSTLAPLSTISIPPENYALPAYRRGIQAAQRVRSKLGINETDPHGADRLFELLNIDPVSTVLNSTLPADMSIAGLAQRDNQDAKISLLQPKLTQRRFTAARAAYAAWTFELQKDSRLLTHAVTRDQQANRAFAAEMTSPLPYIRSQARGSRISQDQLFELAATLNIEPGVVRKHAENNGLQVRPVF